MSHVNVQFRHGICYMLCVCALVFVFAFAFLFIARTVSIDLCIHDTHKMCGVDSVI